MVADVGGRARRVGMGGGRPSRRCAGSPPAEVDAARPPIYARAVAREAEELFRAAAALPEIKRAALVVRLLDSIGGAGDVVASHAGESKARLAAVREDGVEILDDDDAWRLISG